MTEYKMGDAVEVYLAVEVDGQKFSKWEPGVITCVRQFYSGTGNINVWYSVSNHKPEEYRTPKVIVDRMFAVNLRRRTPPIT